MPALALLTPRSRRNAATALQRPAPGRYLAIDDGPELVMIRLRSELTRVGRSISADVALEDGAASRRHALLLSRPGAAVELVDDGSRNGTWVNGERVERRILEHGDVIRVGRTLLRFLELPGDASQETCELPAGRPDRELTTAA